MRIRYQMAGAGSYVAECDLSEKEAKKRFESLKRDALCEWGELIGEEDENYMEVLEDFDHTRLARIMKSLKDSMGG